MEPTQPVELLKAEAHQKIKNTLKNSIWVFK
jgi:hypothetical protein